MTVTFRSEARMSADTIVVRSYAFREMREHDVSALESKAETDPKEWLLARKREIMGELAPLAAMHRSNGQGTLADAARKRHRAMVAKRIAASMEGKAPSEALLERLANADDEHVKFCEGLEADAVRYQILAAEKEEIDYRLRARETEINAYSSELRLAR